MTVGGGIWDQIQELLRRQNQEDLMTTWLRGQNSEQVPGFWLEGGNEAIRECRWRKEFYEDSNHFYVGQIAFEVLVGHSVKDLQ